MFMWTKISRDQSCAKTNGNLMDPRDILLIRQYGHDTAQRLLKLAADPKLDLLEQIKYSDVILKIRNRTHFRQKISIAN